MKGTAAREPSAEPSYRILYHHRTQALDGQRVHINEIQRALRARGHTVVEVAPLAAEAAGADASRSRFKRTIERISERTPAGVYELAELAYNLVAYVRLSRAIRSVRPDFIYERYALNTAAGIWAARRFGVPLLLEINSPLADEKKRLGKLVFYRIARRIERYVVANATRTLAVTGVLKRILVAATGVREDRVLVIQNGVDLHRFGGTPLDRDAVRRRAGVAAGVVIGAVGFFRAWHGIDVLLRAVHGDPQLRRTASILLVGDGPAVQSLRSLAGELGLDGRVTFLGSVPHDDVPPLIDAMDVVLIPRAVDYASPLKLFEYMAARKAIVAARQPNLEEVLTDGVDALFFPPEDQAALQSALRSVVGDESLRHRLAAAARDTIDRRNLTWDGNAVRIVQAFEQTARGPRAVHGAIASSNA